MEILSASPEDSSFLGMTKKHMAHLAKTCPKLNSKTTDTIYEKSSNHPQYGSMA
ncbi:hypothetical protein SAMN06269250_0957 [Spirosoma fluviale]|uniref:Uncharacterized protein n=1 Tax=Spirosoma fluviale TaxID=1597977 RepID=A0A286F992_9BACT|nr:hypothetical protein SAMN06269250_0957 [Spirosoma fluviale]